MPSLSTPLPLIRLTVPATLIALWLFFSPNLAHSVQAEIIFVDAGSPADEFNATGESWEKAYRSLQDALMNSPQPGDEIWVAAGVYYPDEGQLVTDDERNSTFQLIDDVAIYGGFAGDEDSRAARNFETNITVLSGDIGQDDNADDNGILTSTDNISGSNAFHVVTGSGVFGSAILDGFTITAGATASNCVAPCTTIIGGGMYNQNGSPTIRNVVFSANRASESQGGGVYNDNSSPTFTNVSFLANSAGVGGGMANFNKSSPTLTNVSFESNRAGETDSSGNGGGMANFDESNPRLDNVSFNGNGAARGGGIFNAFGSSPTLNNVSFNANRAGDRGGGIFNNGSNPVLTNVIIWGNAAANELDKSIFNEGDSNPTINHSLIEGQNPPGTGNFDDAAFNFDPGFKEPGDPNTPIPTPGDLRLRLDAPVINRGDNSASTTITDLGGNPRIQQGTIDLGAFEQANHALQCPVEGVLFVKQGGTGNMSGASWDDAGLLQDALAAEGPCEIWVAAGLYFPDVGTGFTSDSRFSTFHLKSGISVYGGFAGNEENRSDRDFRSNFTVLSGDIDENDAASATGTVTTTENISGSNALHVVTTGPVNETAILDGFTISAGHANEGFFPECSFCGGGFFSKGGSPALTNITFRANSAASRGGGMSSIDSSPTLTNVSFNANTSEGSGGGMSNQISSPTLANVTFNGNVAPSGGGMFNSESNITLLNATFSANLSRGGSSTGGAIFTEDSILTFANSIMWGNSSNIAASNSNSVDFIPTFSHSLLEGEDLTGSGAGNLNGIDLNNPLFLLDGTILTDPPTPGNLRLQAGSPLINRGDNSANTTATDLDGNPRIQGGVIDLGAFEHTPLNVACPAGGILFVKEGGAGALDGSSWENAFAFVQDALAVNEPCEIWVAQGLYFPDDGAGFTEGNRNSTFQLKSGVELYGGFVGTEDQHDAREPQNNVTSLSGDIDAIDFADAFHVVTGSGVDSSALLDGFTIRDGLADGTNTDPCTESCGGGIYIDNGSPILRNLILEGNFAQHHGGAMVNLNNAAPSLTNVLFRNNSSELVGGGAMSNLNAAPVLTDVTFERNNTDSNGGGMLNDSSSPLLHGVAFVQNDAINGSGGGIYNANGSSPEIVNAIFNANFAGVEGGGMANMTGSSPRFFNVTLHANFAGFDGGGIFNSGSSPSFTNVIVWGNRDDLAADGPIDASAQIHNTGVSTTTISFSLVQGSGGSGSDLLAELGIDGGGNIDEDPLFVQEGDLSGEFPSSGDLHLQTSSPAIDKGDTSANSFANDLDGNPRVQGDAIDMGAFEFGSSSSNQPPVALGQQLTTTVDTAITVTLIATDTETISLTFSIVVTPSNGSLTGTGSLTGSVPILIYTPNAGFSGTDSFTFQASDGTLDSAPATVNIRVESVDLGNPIPPPTADPQNVETEVDQAVTILLTGSGVDNASLTFDIDNPPINGALTLSGTTAIYTPTLGFAGNDSFTFVVKNGPVSSAPATVTIQVKSSSTGNPDPDPGTQNTPPVAEEILVDLPGATKPVILGGSDADGDSLTFSIVTFPANGTLSGTAPNLTYTPNSGFDGTDSFTYVANDSKVNSTPATVTIQVEPADTGNPNPDNPDPTNPNPDNPDLGTPNTAPVAEEVLVDLPGATKPVILGGTDADGDALTFIIVTQPANGTLTGTAPNLTYTPNPGFAETDSFTYKVSDGQADSDPATVTIRVGSTPGGTTNAGIFLPFVSSQ